MKAVVTVAFAVTFMACSDEPRFVESDKCAPEKSTAISEFILKCIEGGNPKSDEEPEDWIRHCETMARNTYCEKVRSFHNFIDSHWTAPKPCTEAKTTDEKTVCGM